MSYLTDRHSKKGTKMGIVKSRQKKRVKKNRGSKSRQNSYQLHYDDGKTESAWHLYRSKERDNVKK